MEIGVDIDDDVLQAVRERARQERRPLGAVLSSLVRQALGAGRQLHGFEPFPPRGPAVSNELIDRLREGELP